jgi:hypothetical protein
MHVQFGTSKMTRRRTRAGCRSRTTSGWRCTGWCRAAATATLWCSTSPAWARRSATRWTATTRPSAPWTRSRRAPSWTTRSTRPSSASLCTASSCMHAIVDACHSAGVLDLRFLCRVRRSAANNPNLRTKPVHSNL